MLTQLSVAVIGAGVAGLAVGIRLAREGHHVTLFERFPEARPVGSGLMLQPTGLAALERLGLRDAITSLGARINRLHGSTDRGATVFDLGYSDLVPGLHAIAVHRAALHGVLWDGLCGSGASIETARAIASVEAVADGRARLVDASGRATPAFDLVLDASGAHSTLRPAPGGAPFAYGAVWASVPDSGFAPNSLTQRYIAAHTMLGWLPVGRATAGGAPLAAFFWSLKPDGHAAWAQGFAAWQEQVAALWPAMASVVAALPGPEALTLARYMHYTAPVPFRGPLVLLGDSAHATSPQLGQGANAALLDAMALADALERCADIPTALAAYGAARRAHIRFYQAASRLMTPFFQSDSATLAWARDRVFDRLKLVPYLRREMIRTLAGLKTGAFSHEDATRLAGAEQR
ncbi:MAG: NAD(P)/FAD-dependent oxidoreductase [Pseudomonadota bacterium]